MSRRTDAAGRASLPLTMVETSLRKRQPPAFRRLALLCWCLCTTPATVDAFHSVVVSATANSHGTVVESPNWLSLAAREVETHRRHADLPMLAGVNGEPPDINLFRPHNGLAADKVTFGIYIKSFFGIQFKDMTFSADLVITLSWYDPRAAGVIPHGNASTTFASEVAGQHIWLPDVQVTNRDIKGLEVVSSSVTVYSNGSVMKVERVIATVKSDFKINDFPFDTQCLRVRVASTSLSREELVLDHVAKDSHLWGVRPDTFDGKEFAFISQDIRSFEEDDGMLHKSRGELQIVVKRQASIYWNSLFFPALLLLCVSWTVFFFPLLPPFAMPRVATAVIAFLALMTVSTRIDSLLPLQGRLSWMHLFIECCAVMLFAVVCYNILVTHTYHVLDLHDLAEKIDKELRIFYPALTLLVLLICMLGTDGRDVNFLKVITRLVLVIALFGYLLFCIKRVLFRKDMGTPSST